MVNVSNAYINSTVGNITTPCDTFLATVTVPTSFSAAFLGAASTATIQSTAAAATIAVWANTNPATTLQFSYPIIHGEFRLCLTCNLTFLLF